SRPSWFPTHRRWTWRAPARSELTHGERPARVNRAGRSASAGLPELAGGGLPVGAVRTGTATACGGEAEPGVPVARPAPADLRRAASGRAVAPGAAADPDRRCAGVEPDAPGFARPDG